MGDERLECQVGVEPGPKNEHTPIQVIKKMIPMVFVSII